MTAWQCEFESEVLAAVVEARWPGRAGADLVAHAAGCPICADIVTIASAIEGSREEMSASGRIPDSGRAWWLAQRRARLEDAEIANRPLQAAQWAALVCAIALLAVYGSAAAARFAAGIGRIASGSGFALAAGLTTAAGLLAGHAGLALAMAAVLLLVPAAACLAIGRE